VNIIINVTAATRPQVRTGIDKITDVVP